jgi:eukaryotic-like serine/threonine-protein kinase
MLIGRRVNDRYKILRMIGGGGMAKVYLARDMILDRDVAVKILRLDFANEQEFIHRFQREAQSATSLVHPNIVSVYDVGEEDDIYYIVMEYVEGMTLKQYIQQHYPISVEKSLDIMGQLASAISHAHQNHIIHRDIKPHNILLDHSGNVKITDFGIAMALTSTSITQTNSVLGSVHYLSPEQARGGMATRKSDIYSLGIVMFELLTGRLPFSGESAVAIALKHLQTETPSPKRWNSSIPQSVENIILKSTAKDPFMRYDSVEEMAEDIHTALSPERINENKFEIPDDDDVTKALPIITDSLESSYKDATLVHSKEEMSDQNKDLTHNKKEKKKRRKWPWVLAFILLLFLIAGAAGAVMLPKMMGPKSIGVPDVKKDSLKDAMTSIVSSGLKVGDTINAPSESVDEGHVIKTDPNSGTSVSEGTSIDLYVSTGKEKTVLSDYTGRSYDDIVALLKTQNFRSINKNETTDDAPAGTIISQTPTVGEEVVPEDTDLTFTVSKGPEKINVADLSDYTAKDLSDYSQSTGLLINMTEEENSDTVKEGHVISQNPKEGTELEKGETVQVVMSKGPKELPPKIVDKEITIPYEPKKQGDPQEVQIFIEDMNNNISEPYETFEITSTSTKKLQFTVEKGKKAYYKVMRDNTVIAGETVNYPDS